MLLHNTTPSCDKFNKKVMKKIIAIYLLLVVATLKVFAQSTPVYLFSYFKDNGQDGLHLAYSHDGYKFTALKNDSSFLTPVLSKDKLMRDPCIIRGGDNNFHMVWTVSWHDGGIGYASSPDLINWGPQQYIPVMAHEKGTLNAWAPEIFFNAKTKEYIIYWASTIPGRFPETDTSGDGNNNHRMYYIATKDFKIFSPTKLLYDQGFSVIDATIQQAGIGFIMFLKDETKKPVAQKNIRTAISKKLISGYGKPSAPITGNYWAEGPTVTKIGKQWIVYFDKYTAHTYGAVTSADFVNWTDISEKISFPKGTRHGTVFKITTKELNRLLK